MLNTALEIIVVVVLSVLAGVWACWRYRRTRQWQKQYVKDAEARAAQQPQPQWQ